MAPMRFAMMAAFIFISTCSVVNAQDLIYEFNANGELQKGAPTILSTGSTIHLKIAFDSVLFLNQVHTIQLNALNALVFWTGRLTVLQNVKPRPEFLDQVDILIDNLQGLYDAFNGKNMTQLLALAPDYLCNAKPTAEDNNYKFTPSPQFIIARLCRQFRVVMKCAKKDCKTEVPLCIAGDCPPTFFFGGSCSINHEDAIVNLYKLDALKGLTIDWYNSKVHLFDYFNVIFLDRLINSDPIYKSVSEFLQKYAKMKIEDSTDGKCDTILKALNDLEGNWPNSPAKHYDDSVDVALNAFAWSLDFAWMNKLAFNPFGFTNAELYRALNTSSTKDTKNSDIDTTALNQVDTLLVHEQFESPPDLNQVRLYLDVLAKRDSIRTKADSLTMAKTKSAQASSGKSDTANQASLAAYQQVGVLRNQVVTLLSDKKDTFFNIRNYYFNRDVDKRKFKYELPDNEGVILAIHNLPTLDTVHVSSNLVAYNEQTTIASSGIGALQGLVTNTLPSLDIADKTGTFDQSSVARVMGSVPQPTADCKKNVNGLIKDLTSRIRKLKVFDSLYSVAQLPPLTLQRTYSDTAQLRTRNFMPDGGNKAPFEVDYKLYVKDTSKTAPLTLLDSSFYKIRKRRFAELALGFSYSISYERQVNPDSANSNYNVTNVENKLQYVVGVKLHVLRKIYWGNDHFIGFPGANDWRTISERLSLFLGVSLPDPTNYLYGGIGVDLVPGLNLNGGLQLYKYNKYTIANNAILDQSTIYKRGFYFSVTTDPLLFVTLITTFFK